MQLYDAEIRLSGDLTMTVPKFGLTAPEVMLLREIHGQDAVVGLSPVKSDKRPHEEEADRLSKIYGARRFDAMFGAMMMTDGRLPIRLRDVDHSVKTAPKKDDDDTKHVDGLGTAKVDDTGSPELENKGD